MMSERACPILRIFQLPFKVNLTFERVSRVLEKGGATVVVNNPNDMDEIAAQVKALDFSEFLVTDRDYSDSEWKWEAQAGPANDDTPSS